MTITWLPEATLQGTRPAFGGPFQWQLAARAVDTDPAGGIPVRMRGELMRLLDLTYGEVAPAFVYRVSRLAFALNGCSARGSLGLSATSTKLLMELVTPLSQQEAPAVRKVVTFAHLASVSDSCGSYLTFGEMQRQVVHWASLALPIPSGLDHLALTRENEDVWS